MEKIKQYAKENKVFCIFMLLIFLYGFYLRLKVVLLNICIQSDEIWVLENLSRTYIQLFKPLINNQVVPVGFLFMEKFLAGISVESCFLHILPFSFSLIALGFFPFFASKFLNNKYIISIAYFMFAIHPSIITYSTVVKSYILDVLFTMVIIYLVSSLDLKKDSVKKLLIIGISLGIILWFSLASGFILIASLIAFAIYNRKDLKTKKLLPLMLPIIISLAFYSLWLKNVYYVHYEFMKKWWYVTEKTIGQYHFLNQILKEFNLLELSRGFDLDVFSKNLINLITLWFFFITCKCKKSLYLILPIVIMYACHFLSLYPIHLRLSLYIVPIFLLVLLIPYEQMKKLYSKIIMGIVILVFLVAQIKYVSSYDIITLMNRDWLHGNSCTDAIEYVNLIKNDEYYNKNDRIFILFTALFVPPTFEYHFKKNGISNEIIVFYSYENLLEVIGYDKKVWLLLAPKYSEQIRKDKRIKVLRRYQHQSYTEFGEEMLYIEFQD
ncbi:MAG: hypothetical protein MJ229_01685 [bacterium]|nr:hypothetical protein [bacterium]